MKTLLPVIFVAVIIAGCASYQVEIATQKESPQPTPSAEALTMDAKQETTTAEGEPVTITENLSETQTSPNESEVQQEISGTLTVTAMPENYFVDQVNGNRNVDALSMGALGEPNVTYDARSNPRNNFPTAPVLTAPDPAQSSSQWGAKPLEFTDATVSADFSRQLNAPAVTGEQLDRRRSVNQLSSLGYTVSGALPVVPMDKHLNDLSLIKRSQTPGTEEYEAIEENPFHFVSQNPLSTFSVDVDTASYSNIRRFIMDNQLPPKDAVRIEELVNYFTYDYPQPDDEQPFAVYAEVAKSPWNPQNKLVHVGLQGKSIPADDLPYSNLVFLLDVSGSMKSADKLPLVKSAFKLLVNQMRPGDRVAVVTYAGAAGLALPSTSGNQKDKLLEVIDKLEAGGSTAGGEGIQLAYKIAKENFVPNGNNRVILATDGDFNVGVSDTDELVRLIEEKRKDGIFLTITGFGTGNLKDEKMENLADKGNGNYAYIDSLIEAKKVFVNEMGGTFFTIAKDVKIQVEFNPAKVKAYRLIGYENRILQDRDFNDDTKDAGEIGSGHTVTALYEIVTPDSDFALPEVDDLKYQEVVSNVNTEFADELMTVKLRYKKPDEDTSKLTSVVINDNDNDDVSDNMNFSAAVAQFGMLLRGSSHKGEASFKNVITLAKAAKGSDDEGYRAEFIRLVEMAELLNDSEAISASNMVPR